MAQDAELKLKVSLDLAFFRQQLNTLGTQLGGQSLQLNIQFNKKSIADQYRLLGRYLEAKTFKVKVESNTLDVLAAKVSTFKKNLEKLGGEIIKLGVNVESEVTKTKAAEVRRNIISDITGPKGVVFIPIEVKPPLVKNIKAIRDNIKDRLSGIVVEIEAKLKGGAISAQAPGVGVVQQGATSKRPSFLDSPAYQAELQKIAKANAQVLAKAAATLPSGRNREEVERLLQAFQSQNPQGTSRSSALGAIRELIARGRYQQGLGFEASLQPIRGQRQTSAARSMPNLNQMLDRIANLTENPRAAQRMLRMIPESRITTDLVGTANKQAEFRQEGLKFLDLKGKAFDPLFSAIAQSFTNYTRSVNPSNPWVGKIGNGVKQLIERALALSPEEMFGGKAPVASSKLLPAAGQSSASRMMRTAFSGLPAIMSPQIGMENAPLSRAATYMLNKARRALEMPIGPASPYAPSPFAGAATVPPRSFFRFGQGPQLPGAPVQAALPPAGTTTNYGGGGFFGYGGVSGSGGGDGGKGGALAFPGGAMGRATQLPSSYLALGKASAELKKFEGFFNTNKLPLAGAIEELAGEFGNATKQVLLYGTAYKALAFFMDLPSQALNAAKSLQTFNNQLNAITGSSENADRAFTFVDNLAARFNVPLESARQGFVKLYASMAPAGFSSGEIENLFTGISKASATLGLSSDKVDRVTYAFSQMASKGQLMSEEVSGQLGDVIPGALSIMAEAARMDIATFKKAMEDGVFVGETFKQVMSNVPIVLENRFGKGAAGAAKTLQGSMNALAISTQKFYESFEPIVSMGAASIFPIIATAINDATQAVQAFTTAMQGNATLAQMLEGNAAQIYGVLQQLREVFVAVAGIIQGIAPTLMIVGKAFLTTAEYIAKLVSTPIGGFLADLAVKAGIALIAVQLFAKTGIAGLISQLILLQRSTAAAGGGLLTFASTLTKKATAAKLFRLAITGLIGAGILFGIEALVNAIGRMANRLSDARKNAIAARDAIKSMSGAELGEQMIVQQNKLQALSRTQKAGGKITSEQDRKILEQIGMRTYATGGKFIGGQLIGGQYGVDKNLIESFRIREQEQLKAIQDQRKSLYDTTPLPLNEVELGAGKGGDKGAEKALKAAEQAAKQEQQRRIELAGLQNDIDKIGFDYRMSLSDTQFEHEKRLIDELNNYELSGLNDMQARQLKFAQDLKKVRLDAEDAIRKAIQKTEAAQLNVTTAQRTAQAAGAGRGENSGPVIGGFTSTQLSNATTAASKFTGIANMCSESVKAFYKSLGISLPGVTAWADTVRNAGTTMKDWSKLAPGDIVATGKPGDTPHVGVYTGGQNVFHQSRSRGLKAGNYPDLDYFKQGGYFVRPNAGMKQSSASFSMDTKSQKESFDLIKEQAKASAQSALQQLEIQNALKIAYVQTASTIKANIDNIFPVEKQKLDLSLQQMRHNLLMQGMPQEYIDYEEKRAAATEEAAMAVNVMKDSLSGAKAELKVYNDAVAGGTKLSVDQQANVTRLTGSIAALEEGLANAAKQQREYNIASLESAIATMKQADALKAMEEVSGRINDAVTGVTDTYKSMFKEIAMGEDSVEALKKAQKALADQFLTMVFDMAMKPVEESMKNTLGKMFGVPNEKEQREKTIASMEAQLAELQAHKVHLQNIETNTGIAAGKSPVSSGVPAAPAVPNQMTAAGTSGGFLTGTAALQTLPFNGQTGGMLQNLPFPAGDTGFLSAIGINGEELSASISESANAYSEQLSKVDTSVFESANALGTAGTELGKEGAAGKKWHESLGQAVGGLGMAAGAVMGIVAGISQIKEGGTSNVLGGIGMIASMAGSLLGNFGGLFGGGGGASSIVQGTDIPIAQMPAGMQFANGGVAFGGFRAFANGGTVSGPTLGLVGEGKYNEAIVPLPDGRSIPVQLGGRSARDLMGNGAPGMPQAPSLSMKFETTKINGVEYVSREQLEQAMAETRRASIAGGAKQGMSMTLDKIKQSPSTRSSIGIR